MSITLEQAVAYLHPHVNSSHNTDWQKKRKAWDVLMEHIDKSRVLSDEMVGRLNQWMRKEQGVYMSTESLRAALTAALEIGHE